MTQLFERDPDATHMRHAIAQANLGALAGEVPVGAVVVRHGEVIASSHNQTIASHDPCGHAEVLAIRAAAVALGNHRLDDCELFVTLEPCAMCAGAALHARLKRVVFGAIEPKTGAVGSVINVLADTKLNHQTTWKGGVLAHQCAQLMQDFFRARRQAHAQCQAAPLRDDALRPPESRFADLPDYPWPPSYRQDGAALGGLRMHYLDLGPKDAPTTWLCLHGNPTWSYLYRHMIPHMLEPGDRVVAPDLIGFGKSDKPKKEGFHGFEWHRQVLLELVQELDLKQITLVVQDWGGLLGLTLAMAQPQRFERLLVMNTTLATGEALPGGFLAWRDWVKSRPQYRVSDLMARAIPRLGAAELAAYDAPFPDSGHRAALRAFPTLVPDHPDAPGALLSRQAQAFWRNTDGRGWTGKSFMAIGEQDPVLGVDVMTALRAHIFGCPKPTLLPDVGHFVPEGGPNLVALARQSWAD